MQPSQPPTNREEAQAGSVRIPPLHRVRGPLAALALCGVVLVVARFAGTGPGMRIAASLAKWGLVLAACATGLAWWLGALLPNRRRRAFARFIGLALALGLGTLAAEAAVRTLFRDISTTSDNASYFALRWWRRHPPRLNALGFRERAYATPAAPGTYRIAVVGDSFAYGQGLMVEERFSNRIEAALQEAGRTVEVLNFGYPGAETIHQVDILRDSVLPAQPDFVLLQWHVNDVEQAYPLARPRPRRLIPSDFATNMLQQHSALYWLPNRQWVSVQTRVGWLQLYEDHLIEHFGDPNAPASQAADAALATFIAACRDRDVPLGIALFPQLAPGLLNDYPLGFLMDRVLTQCAESDVPCLDLRPTFAPVQPPQRLWVNPLDPHPNARANALTADAMLRFFAPAWLPDTPAAPADA